MKTILTVITVLLIGCVERLFGQTTASEQIATSATIITPVSMTKDLDMNFGNTKEVVAAKGAVTLSPDGARHITKSDSLFINDKNVSPASYTVSGAAGYTYSMTLPDTAEIALPGKANGKVRSFTCHPAPVGTLNKAGSQTFKIGATLYIMPAQTNEKGNNKNLVPISLSYN